MKTMVARLQCSFLIALFGMILLAMPFFIDSSFASDETHSGTLISQQKINYRDVVIEPDKSIDCDKLTVEAYMVYKGEKLHIIEKIYNKAQTGEFYLDGEGQSNGPSLTIEVPYYGKWYFTSKYINGESVVRTDTQVTGVSAEEYRIAPLMSSIPVLIYSLKFLSGEIPSVNGDGEPVPSVVTLAREDQYNWSSLPDNMYDNPYVTKGYGSGNNSISYLMPAIKAYVKDLIEIDPTSIFHFYMNDFHFDQVLLPLVYQTGLDDDKYSLTFITDGAGVSYNTFKEVYGGKTDAGSEHEKLVSEYRIKKEEMRNGGTYSQSALYKYIYAIIDAEEDAEWWVIRKSAGDTFLIEDKDFLSKVIADKRVSSNYINGLLAAVTEAGKGDALKDLYKFRDDVFEEARQNNKTPMMILGTSSGVEQLDPIDNYARIMMIYYGDGYEYIYKGHPGNIPTQERKAEIESLGMRYVDPSIAAELFMFYNPDTLIAGYPSTTFLSANDPSLSKALFMLPREEACNSKDDMWSGVAEYAHDAEIYISRITKRGNDHVVGAAAQATSRGQNESAVMRVNELDDRIPSLLVKSDSTYYLLEFADGSEHDFGVWEQGSDRIIYLDKDDEHDRAATLEKSKIDALQTIKELAADPGIPEESKAKASEMLAKAELEIDKTTSVTVVNRVVSDFRSAIKQLMSAGTGDISGPSQEESGNGNDAALNDKENDTTGANSHVSEQKKKNSLKLSFANKRISRKKIKTRKVRYRAVRIKDHGQGKLTYKIKYLGTRSRKVLSFNKKKGTITVKKNTQPGRYRIRVSVKAKGNATYQASKTFSKVIVVKVK